MLGYSGWRKAKKYDAGIAARRAAGQSLFMDELAPDWFEFTRLNGAIITIPSRNMLYMANPKVASTSIRNRLHEMQGGAPLADPTQLHGGVPETLTPPPRMNDAALREACLGPKCFRFTFVRNPFDRLISSYQFFQQQKAAGILTAPKRRLLVHPRDPRRNMGTFHAPDFAAFVRSIIEQPDIVHDQHWRPQSDCIRLDQISYDFIGKVENLGPDFATILERLNAPEHVIAKANDKSNISRKTPLDPADFYTPDTIAMAKEIYAKDFEAFGYSTHIKDVGKA